MIDAGKLKTLHEEELKDSEKYRAMAEECPEFEQIFRDMSKEEACHARMICYMIEHT